MYAEDDPAAGAEALEGGDDPASAIEVGGDRIGDADAANQQRRQANQGEELAQPLQGPRHLRRGIAPIANGKARFRQGLLYALAEGGEPIGGRLPIGAELEGVAPADQAARIDQSAAAQGFER